MPPTSASPSRPVKVHPVTVRRVPRASISATPIRLTLLGLALLGAILPLARATVPASAQYDPLYAKGYLVVTYYPGVYNNETNAATTTAGLNEALADAYTNNLVAYFPPGTYLVNNTLRGHTATGVPPNAPGYTHATPRNHLAVVGSTAASSRPLIKLAANASGFSSADSPKPVLEFKNFDVVNTTVEEAASGYHQMVRGVDLDCGSGNPGAIGLYFNQAQDSSIENVKITATGAFAGIRGLPSRGSHVVNIEIEGGQYGIDTQGAGSAGTVIAGAVLRNQTAGALRSVGFVPLTLVGFQIVTPAGSPQAALAIEPSGVAHNSGVNLIDGSITLGAEPSVAAIDNSAGMNFYARNVHLTGGDKLVKSPGIAAVTGTGAWKRIDEYGYCSQATPDSGGKTSWTLIDGIATRTPGPLNNGSVASITDNAPPPPADLVTRHVWTALPSVDDPDAVDAFALGIAPGNVSAAALQGVINGHRKIFLRKGFYSIDGTITLRKDTILFGAARFLTRIECQPSWNPTSETPIITTVNDATATTYLGELSIGVDATDLANDWFVALDWQAGRSSLVHIGRVYRAPAAITPLNRRTTQPHSLLRVRGSGGGRWYGTGSGLNFASAHPAFRILKVEDTTEPLWFYGMNPEHPESCETYVQFTNARNVRIYALKSEFAGAASVEDLSKALQFDNVTNVALFGHGAIRNAVQDKGVIEFLGAGTDRVLATLIAPQYDAGTATGDTLRENPGSGPVGITYPNVVVLYKRGSITAADEAAMTIAATPNTAPSVSITSPAAGASLPLAATTITATASDRDDAIALVEFYANGTFIADDTTMPYAVSWLPAAPGNHSLTAVAMDDLGAITRSATVTVTVASAPAPAPSGKSGGGGAPSLWFVAALSLLAAARRWQAAGAETASTAPARSDRNGR